MSFVGDVIGTIKQNPKLCGACGPAITVVDNCSSFGPEFVFDSPGICGTCGFNCLGTLCTVGTRANCRKFQHTANINDCCLGNQPSGFPNITCDPSLTPLSSSCFNTVLNNCSNSKIFSDSLCKSWAAQNPTQAFTIKKTICTPDQIKTNPDCRNFVINEAQGKIDDVMVLNYCQNNPTDDLCTCIMSQLPCPNKFDTNCIQKGGYKTSDMLIAKCPDILTCTQQVNIAKDAIAIAVNIEQNCPSQNSNPTPTPTPVPISQPITSALSKNVMIFIFIFIIIFIFGIISYMNNKSYNINPSIQNT